MPNYKSESCDDELKERDKVFQLRVNWYFEEGNVKLAIPCFANPKAEDIRVVWDSKVNRHNAALWAPSFILADFGDLEETVIKWLSTLVANCLHLQKGSPGEDCTEGTNQFIKTRQEGLDSNFTISFT